MKTVIKGGDAVKTFDTPGPVIIGVHVDYRDNHELFELVHANSIH